MRPQPLEHSVELHLGHEKCEGYAEMCVRRVRRNGWAVRDRSHLSIRRGGMPTRGRGARGRSHLSRRWGSLCATERARGVPNWRGGAACDRSYLSLRWGTLWATKHVRGVLSWGGEHATPLEPSVEPPLDHNACEGCAERVMEEEEGEGKGRGGMQE